MDDDDTPVRPPAVPISSDGREFIDAQLGLLELSRLCGMAAERIDHVAAPDRADVRALFARRGLRLAEKLRELFEGMARA
jgi:hypothetical protein